MTDEESVDAIVVVRAEDLVRELPLQEPDWDALEQRVKDGLAAAPTSEDALFTAPFPELGDTPPSAADPAPSPLEAPPAAAEVAPSPLDAPPPTAAEAAPSPLDAPPPTAAEAAPSPLDALADATESERAPGSLAELARAAVARRSDAQSSSIAKESLALASQRRAQGDESRARVPEGSSRRAITLPPARKNPSSDVRTLWLGVGIAAVGLAAGFGLYLKGASEPQAVVIAQGPAAPAGPVSHPAATTEARTGAAPPSPGGPGLTIDRGPRGVSLDELAGEAPSKTASPAAAMAGGVATGAPAASASPTPVRAERVVLEEEAPAAGPAKPAPAPASAPLRPAELNRESGTGDRPSGGAAQAAVGSVLGAARSCIAGHPKPSSATLVFGSSGEVTSVSVGGPAAGTPAAGCIESALKKARVQPFAAPTFSLAVTVRPP